MIRYIYLQGVKYNKTSFANKWKLIVNSHRVGTTILPHSDLHAFLTEVVSYNEPWKKILNRGTEYKFKIIDKKFHGRKVKGVALITPNTQKEVWIGKQKVLDVLFPPKLLSVEKNNKKLALAALRQTIEPQVRNYRDAIRREIKKINGRGVRCALTGEKLRCGSFHIDHVYPFKLIVEEWCRENNLDLESLEVVCRGTKCRLKNKKLGESFSDYHLLNANLQATTATANMKKGSKY